MKKSSQNTKKQKQATHWKLSTSLRRALGGVLIFFLGALVGPYIWQKFAETLPGPKMESTIQGLRGNLGNAAGCIVYQLILHSEEPIEYVYVKIQFPHIIHDYIVGTPAEAETDDGNRISTQMWVVGKNEQGQCAVKTKMTRSVDIRASALDHMITIQASKLPPKAYIMGVVATSKDQVQIKPPPKLYMEGSYEYIKLGQTVRKPILFSYKGIVDAIKTPAS
jgi:hypothetical protein